MLDKIFNVLGDANVKIPYFSLFSNSLLIRKITGKVYLNSMAIGKLSRKLKEWVYNNL